MRKASVVRTSRRWRRRSPARPAALCTPPAVPGAHVRPRHSLSSASLELPSRRLRLSGSPPARRVRPPGSQDASPGVRGSESERSPRAGSLHCEGSVAAAGRRCHLACPSGGARRHLRRSVASSSRRLPPRLERLRSVADAAGMLVELNLQWNRPVLVRSAHSAAPRRVRVRERFSAHLASAWSRRRGGHRSVPALFKSGWV